MMPGRKAKSREERRPVGAELVLQPRELVDAGPGEARRQVALIP